jgi:hypothetical protein
MELNLTITLTENSLMACVVGLSVVFLVVFGFRVLGSK